MYFRIALAAGLLVATAAQAQKPTERSPYEIGYDAVEDVEADGAGGFVAETSGVPRSLSNLGIAVAPGTPEDQAREFLAEYGSALLQIGSPDELQHVRTRSSLAGHTVRFQQTVNGVPVLAHDIAVSIDLNDRVQYVASGYVPGLALSRTTPVVTDAAARQATFDHLNLEGTLRVDETTLVAYPLADGVHLAWQVRLMADSPRGDWEALVDATDGTLLRVADRAVYHGGGDDDERPDPPSLAPTVEAAWAYDSGSHLLRVDGIAAVFVPDPLTRDGVPYGTPGYVDGNDADTPELTGARTVVALRDITFNSADTTYSLVGPYAEIREIEGPALGTFEQQSDDWTSTRNPAVFEGALVYYHLDAMMRYINEDLGITLMPDQYVGGVRFDAHALNGADNSYYSGGSGAVHFGEGCVDDSEDADVVIHELGHGLHDWLSGISQADGLSEGLGDYFAVSYTRHFGLLAPTDPSYWWVFKWDGHNPCWGGRTANYTPNYPAGGVPHTRGQHWATANMRIWDDIGGQRTDVAMIEGIAMTNSGTLQPQAAQAVMQAAVNMGYTETEVTAMFDRYIEKGYTVTNPFPTAAEPGPGERAEGLDLSQPYPNPLRHGASFTVRVAAAQDVDVALYDGLGRRVQTLYAGPMAAGERRVLSVDARALPSGLYVYRVVGAGASASQRLTITH